MADKPMDVYLNDHLAGSMVGTELAEQISDMNENEELGRIMDSLTLQIEEDRDALLQLMETMDTSKNPVKQVTAWLAEKATRVKFSGLTAGDDDLGTYLAIESLRLGVQGKACLWITLKEVREDYPQLAGVDLDVLLDRAESQLATLEAERLSAARRAFGHDAGASTG